MVYGFCNETSRRVKDTAAGASRSGRLEIYLKAPGTRSTRSCIEAVDVKSLFVYKTVKHDQRLGIICPILHVSTRDDA